MPARAPRLGRLEVAYQHGHGLGLAIVKAVATMHGGGVSAASAGGLTTIGFSVPSAAAVRHRAGVAAGENR
ncbi:MAG: hypothetical protein ACREXI_11730 [Caldimonas sp.]